MASHKYKVGDTVLAPLREDGPKPGKYKLLRRMSGHRSWEAQHEELTWSIQILEEEFVPASLTEPQADELRRLKRARQHTFGSSRARVQNTLVAMRLASFVEDDRYCEATSAGLDLLKVL